MGSDDVLAIAKGKQLVLITLALQDDITSSPSIAPVRSSFGVASRPAKVPGASTSIARTYEDSDLVHKGTATGHGLVGGVGRASMALAICWCMLSMVPTPSMATRRWRFL